MITDIINSVSRKQTEKLEDWIKSLGITINNISKYKLSLQKGIPKYETTIDGVIYTMNYTYMIYPRRGRNAKKPISKIII